MSMLDGFFNKGFKGAKCKTLLKLTIPRIKLLRNRREIQLKQMRRDIAKLLENGQEATARIRVEHIIREENMMAAQEIIELFCELIAVRLPIIETQRECPLDLKEAISSICFAAPRCSDLPELQQVQMLFAAKYGKEFVAAAAELMPDSGVNRQIIELLSVRAPPVEAKLKLLKEIAEEHEVDWDPAASETEFLKPHEDLLNGPNRFISGSTLPLHEEKHVDSSIPMKDSDESDTDADFNSLDLPEVPKATVCASSETPYTPDVGQLRPTLPHHLEPDFESESTPPNKDEFHVPPMEHGVDGSGPSLPYLYTPSPTASVAARENKQFIPFVSSPSVASVSSPMKQNGQVPSIFHNKSEANINLRSVPSVAPTSGNESEASVDSPSVSPVMQSKPTPSLPQTRGYTDMDLQDVVAAAHAAAENAERAAASARAAASLAQVRISELVTKRNNRIPDGSENEFQVEHSLRMDLPGEPTFDHENTFGDINQIPGCETAWSSGTPALSSHDMLNMAPKSPGSSEQAPEHQSPHQPQRSTSLEDDPYYSYPNLFTSRDSSLK